METSIKPKVTPKDFFLWLGAMVSLYVSATSLILLVHSYINVWFPNQLENYGDPYSGTIRFALASLVVMYPLYVWLTHALHVDIRKNPEKKELWVRRWLVVLTLFVAGLTIAIDLIASINTFLSGDLTLRFALKAAVILVVLGGGFWYYVEELRGTWDKKTSLSKIIAWVVSFVVLISIGSAFFIIGSPETERLAKIDQQKVYDLQNIQSQVVNYWQQKAKLPQTIADLENPLSGFVAPKDPQNGAGYIFRATPPLTFELCATFNLAGSNVSMGASVPVPMGGNLYNENWQHGKGETCFTRTIDPQLFPPAKPTSK